MKRTFIVLLTLLAVLTARADNFPQLSSDGNEYWYYLKFTQGAYVVTAHNDAVCCTAEMPAGGAAQLWKVEVAEEGGYSFTNKLGQRLYVTAAAVGAEARASVTPTVSNRFSINPSGAGYTVSPYSNSNFALNCWGGMGMGNDIKLYYSSDSNAPIAFLSESEAQADAPELNLIPYPADLALTDCGKVSLQKISAITYFDEETKALATRFAEDVKNTSGIAIPLLEVLADEALVEDAAAPRINLVRAESTPDEAYNLTVCEGGVKIEAASFGGFFNAMQTLRQLLPAAIYGKELSAEAAWELPSLTIYDEPLLRYRGFHLDVSRHFFTKEEVKKLLDAAAAYKLNRFHWHLTDDQGWRIEIPEYPKLTTIGAVRSRSLTINDPTNSAEFYDDTEYGRGCFYTLDDLREVVAYAKERNIEIIPEVDMPGHMVAAIAAYPELSCDPSKSYEVRVAKGISSDVLNIGKDEVIDFLKCVLGHVAEVFPYDIIHIGGDECPTTVWQNNADCLRRISEEGLSGVNELQPWLVETIGSYLRDTYGKSVLVWDELLANWKDSYTVKPVVMAWRGIGYTGQAADKGFESIAVPTSPLYFDLLQISPDKMEIDAPYFGGYGDNSINSIDKVYALNPLASVSGREQFVIGTQANLWTESLTSNEEAEYQYYPRLLALSETAWLPASKKNFTSFFQRLQHHSSVLDALNIRYAPHYFVQPALTAAESALKEADNILETALPGTVGNASQTEYDALKAAADLVRTDATEDNVAALEAQIATYKAAPIMLPETGHTYRIISASTYFRNRYAGSALYADDTNLRIHYTEQIEPEELWTFTETDGGTFAIQSLLNGTSLILPTTSNTATLGEKPSKIVIRKATKAAGGYDFIPGVVNIKSGRRNLYAQMSGIVGGSTDSTLCYPGTWRIIEVTDFSERLQGLVDKATRILEESKPGEVGEPTEDALEFLQEEVLTPSEEALANLPVSRETYLTLQEKYKEFANMERTSLIDGLDLTHYFYIRNAYHTSYYACANSSTTIVEPKTLGTADTYKWALRKQPGGKLLIENKQTHTCAFVSSNAQDQQVRVGRDYLWTLTQVTTDLGTTAMAIVDGSGAYSWYTNPSAWSYILLKPYDWGASIWELVPTDETITGINEITTNTNSTQTYDLQGRRAKKNAKGVFIENGRKIVRL